MSKESALSMAVQANPVVTEVRVNPVTGNIPENVKEAANPAMTNQGVVPQSQAGHLAHLAKKEAKFRAELQAEREAFKKEQEEFKSIQSRVREVYDKASAFEETRKKDPLRALREIGFTEKEIVDYLSMEEEMSKVSPQELGQKAAQEEIKKFRDEEAKKAADAQKMRDESEIKRFRGELGAVIKKDPEKYEWLAHHGPIAEQMMFDIAVEEAKAGKVPEVQSIADDLEEYYMNEFEASKKLKKAGFKPEIVSEKAPERSRVVHPPQDIVKPKPTTLSNKIAATGASFAKPVGKVETREEKRTRLENMIRQGFVK